MAGPFVRIPDRRHREELAAFVGRVVQLDPSATVRLVGGGGLVTAWASTPFQVLAARSVPGAVVSEVPASGVSASGVPASGVVGLGARGLVSGGLVSGGPTSRGPVSGGPVSGGPDVAVAAASLLTALAVERADAVDPGVGVPWRAEVPAADGWEAVGRLPAAELAAVVDAVLAQAPPTGVGEAELDRTAAALSDGSGRPVRVPVRCLLALSGLGLLTGSDEPVRVAVTRSWLRLETPGGAAVRRRIGTLPLLA